MENRRRDYRHAFPPTERHEAELTARRSGTVLRGDIVDLSLGGMRVRLSAGATTPAPQERFRVTLEVAGDSPLTFDAELAYRADGASGLCGIHFLSLADVALHDARERRLFLFLLDAQRRVRRSKRV